MPNYFDNLLLDDFSLIYFGRWDSKRLIEAKEHKQITVTTESQLNKTIKAAIEGDTIVLITDVKDSQYRSDLSRQKLYKTLVSKKIRGIVLGEEYKENSQ